MEKATLATFPPVLVAGILVDFADPIKMLHCHFKPADIPIMALSVQKFSIRNVAFYFYSFVIHLSFQVMRPFANEL